MSQVSNTKSLSQIMADIDLGPTGSVQMQFAKLQLAQSKICKNQAEDYMKQVQDIQEEQKKCAEMIAKARALQAELNNGPKVSPMPDEMKAFFKDRGLKYSGSDYCTLYTKDEWDYNLKSLTNYQEQIGSKTQTIMVYLNDFIGQYNSYLQGANTAISNATQVLTNIARGQ